MNFTLKLPVLFNNLVQQGSGWVQNLPDRWRFDTTDGQGAIGELKAGKLTFIFTTASTLVTSDHGTVTVGTVPPGFLPTTSLIGKIVWQGTFPFNQTTVFRQISSLVSTSLVDVVHSFLIPDNTPFSSLWGGFTIAELAATGNGSAYSVTMDLDDIYITGNYVIFAHTYTMSPASGSTVNANTPDSDDGTLITLSSVLADPLHLKLNQLTLSVPCGTIVPIVQTETLLTFKIPSSCSGNGSTTITATGNGVQFSGSVPLGSLTVLLTNGSGIYMLTPNATHDTLYSSVRDGTTRNVKIPNPFIKTGFIGG